MKTEYSEAARLSVFFLAFQLKNSYDTLVWNDGIVFVIHHALTLATVWGTLYPGIWQYYGVFYFGISEASTGVLCLLANFDDHMGVSGLGDAFPLVKAILGAMFGVMFITIRILMWSTVSYFAVRDAYYAFHADDPRVKANSAWIKYFTVSLVLLSSLQILWLGDLCRIAHEEYTKMGYI
jgi:TLC domain